ncbi:MAG: winged helix-turn-helix domain-containing protein [Nitrososphaera sp.]
MKHRSRMEITGLILELACCRGVRKTKIMNKANLSYKPTERASGVFN